ncbi:Sporulation domain protein [Maricaulis maris MCS10]|uniref:Sporulation domain protein n=1 Tax=Maricaulis maris (strain MCS10) TaxID=394221 RepID=Q0AND2_MARMM|nr:SPOR domain-containing protein [Maricaulis maris]ABI66205.1 Sporulation domain protein [Maricaulis maris MCS10]
MTDQDEESRIGAYAPPADEFATFDARDEDARRGLLLLTTALAAFVLFLGVVWSAYNQGLRDSGRDGAPRLVPNEEPYRERPVDPGGAETPDTELEVYDRLTGDGAADDTVSLRPAPEEPLEDSGRPTLRVEQVDADAAANTQPQDTPIETDTLPDATPRQAPQRPVREPDPAPEPVVAAPEPAAPSGQVTGVDLTGSWVVQIASFRTEADAEAAWVAFRTRFSDISSGMAPDVASVEIEGRGTYHRLRIAAFGDRGDAVSFCSTLQSRGQDCLVARR